MNKKRKEQNIIMRTDLTQLLKMRFEVKPSIFCTSIFFLPGGHFRPNTTTIVFCLIYTPNSFFLILRLFFFIYPELITYHYGFFVLKIKWIVYSYWTHSVHPSYHFSLLSLSLLPKFSFSVSWTIYTRTERKVLCYLQGGGSWFVFWKKLDPI